MTHTPASGPFGQLTTPPMSSLSIATSFAACCAWEEVTGRTEYRIALMPSPMIRRKNRLVGMGRCSSMTVEERMVPRSNSQPPIPNSQGYLHGGWELGAGYQFVRI